MSKLLAVFLVAIAFTAGIGCSGSASVTKGKPSRFSSSDSEESVLYASAGGASVFSKASLEARLLGKLDAHERVVKIGETKGFTHVRARGGSMIGWVSTSKLTGQVPASTPRTNDSAP